MKIFTRILMLAFLATSFIATAQDEEEGPQLTVSGSIDAYFRANLTAPNKPGINGAYDAPGTSFANLPGFSLGMANVVLGMEGEKAGFVADLVYGPRGTEAVFNSVGSQSIVNQLYAYWNVSDATTLTIGNFNTFLGYEVISPAANFNYSTSYMFSYGPFSHTGLKADFSLSDDASLMLGVFNSTDYTDFNPFGSYTLGAQFGFKGIYFNFLYGDQDGKLDEDFSVDGDTSGGSTFQADITAGWDLTDTFYLGLNATYNTTASGEAMAGGSISDIDGDAANFLGAAAYLQLAMSDAFSIGTRIEYFAEVNGGAGAIGAYDLNGDANVIDVTLTGKYTVGGLSIIPEFRLDSASEDRFLKNDATATSSLSSFVLAAVYSF